MSLRIFITGGLGFVGGRLAVHLAQSGHRVVLGSRKTIDPPTWLPQVEVAQLNWDDAAALEQSCKGVDVVIQAAGMNAQDCASDPVAALAFNGVATARLVAAASRAGVRRIIYLSTAHVYASPLIGTITEETCPRNLHPYATSHLAGEHAVLRADQQGLIQGIVLRLSNAFGAPLHDDVNCWMLLVNDLCRQAVQTGKLILKSTGLQQRDFVPLSEVCRVTDSVAVSDTQTSQDGVLNVGAGVSHTVIEMALLIQERCEAVLGFKPNLVYLTPQQEEQHQNLEYRSTRLRTDRLITNSNTTNEIDELLKFCNLAFRCK